MLARVLNGRLKFLNKVIFCLLFSAFSSASHGETIAIVVSKDSPINLVEASELKMIFLGKQLLFKSGEKISLVNLPYNDPLRIEFSKKLLGKRPSAVDTRWTRLLFTGQGRLPDVVADETNVVGWLDKNKFGIGYINKSSVVDSVRIVHVLE